MSLCRKLHKFSQHSSNRLDFKALLLTKQKLRLRICNQKALKLIRSVKSVGKLLKDLMQSKLGREVFKERER